MIGAEKAGFVTLKIEDSLVCIFAINQTSCSPGVLFAVPSFWCSPSFLSLSLSLSLTMFPLQALHEVVRRVLHIDLFLCTDVDAVTQVNITRRKSRAAPSPLADCFFYTFCPLADFLLLCLQFFFHTAAEME